VTRRAAAGACPDSGQGLPRGGRGRRGVASQRVRRRRDTLAGPADRRICRARLAGSRLGILITPVTRTDGHTSRRGTGGLNFLYVWTTSLPDSYGTTPRDTRTSLEFNEVSSISNGEVRDCGLWDNQQFPTVIYVSRSPSCNQVTTAGHEFGHELGFVDAYDPVTLLPLHSQTADIMTVDGSSILGAHGRILVEKYGF
jgi:hypothetical protein